MVGGLLVAMVGLKVTLREGLLAGPVREDGLLEEMRGVFSDDDIAASPFVEAIVAPAEVICGRPDRRRVEADQSNAPIAPKRKRI